MSAQPAAFKTLLAAAWLDKKRRKLVAPLEFYSAKFDRTFIVPAGYITDLASVPRLPVIYWLFGGTSDEAAALHDWSYDGVLSRKDCDELFNEASKAGGAPGWRTGPMWLAVRLFAGSNYGPEPSGGTNG